MIEEARLAARPGDVLFKSGGGMWGVLAAEFSTRDRTYGHVGVVARGAGGGFVVIHAGGDPASRQGRVMASPFDEFLGASTRAGLYRPRLDEPQITAFLAAAAAEADRRTPFDTAFSLDSDDAVYCTELVWRALSAASGTDAVPGKSARSGRTYIALDDLQSSPVLAPVWRSASLQAAR